MRIKPAPGMLQYSDHGWITILMAHVIDGEYVTGTYFIYGRNDLDVFNFGIYDISLDPICESYE